MPHRRHRRRLLPRTRRPSSSNSSAPVPPRARRGHHCTRCELLCCFPLSVLSFAHRSCHFADDRSSLPPAMLPSRPWPVSVASEHGLSSWGSQEAHAQLSLPKTPPGPRARYHPNSGAAASSVPTSPGVPAASHLPHQMRESPGYAPVPSAAASVAFSASPARCRRHFGRRRRKSGDDDVGIISG